LYNSIERKAKRKKKYEDQFHKNQILKNKIKKNNNFIIRPKERPKSTYVNLQPNKKCWG